MTDFEEQERINSLLGLPVSDKAVEKTEEDDGLIVLSEYRYEKRNGRIGTGFASLDYLLGGLSSSALSVVTGKRGEGKSTLVSQLCLNVIQNGSKVCAYSGELSAAMFQSWIYAQASGHQHMEKMQDQFGNDIWTINDYVQSRIEAWLGKSFLLYDNSKIKREERNTIIDRFKIAREKYDANFFVVDNLMTARYGIDVDRDFYRAQSNFATALLSFAREYDAHVILVAHPRKSSALRGEEDINDEVSGSGDITNLASNVIQVKRATEKDKEKDGADSYITIAKNRDFGRTGKIRLTFNEASRRLVDMDHPSISDYGWVDLC